MLTLCVTEPERTIVTRLMVDEPTSSVKCWPLSMVVWGHDTIVGRGASVVLVWQEQIARLVDFGVLIVERPRCAAAVDHHGRIRQQQGARVIHARARTGRTDDPLAGRRVPDFRAVVDAGQHVVLFRAASRDHAAVGHHCRGHPLALARHRRLGRDGRLRSGDVDDDSAVRIAAHLQDLAGAVHRGARRSSRRTRN